MRDLIIMSWRNLGRNKWRTAITVAAIAFAVIILIFFKAMQTGQYAEMIDNIVKTNSGHLQVQAQDFQEEGDINLSVDNPDEVMKLLENTPGVLAAVPRVMTGMLVSHRDHSFGALIIGTDAIKEAQVTRIAKVMKEGKYLDPADPNGIIIGHKLAKNLKAALGNELILMGAASDGSTAAAKVQVRGIFKMGQTDFDRQFIFANISSVQEWTVMEGRVNAVAILLENYKLIEPAKAQIQAGLDGMKTDIMELKAMTWAEVMPGIDQGIKLDKAFGKITYGILLLVVAFGILNTFLMSAIERTREFGVMLAIGVKPKVCGLLILLESQVLFVVSYVVGAVLGSAIAYYFQTVGIKISGAEQMMEQYGMSGTIYPNLAPAVLGDTFLMVWIIVFIVALYPAWRVTRFRPVEALRHV